MHEEKTDQEPEHGSYTGSNSLNGTCSVCGKPRALCPQQKLPPPIQTQAAPVPDYRAHEARGAGAIKRYSHGPVAIHADPDFEESPDGDVVLWTDHEADRAALAKELEEARAELRRLGHGTEIIACLRDDGSLLCTSRVGDPAWDTAENRRRVFAFVCKASAKVARLTQERDEARAKLEAMMLLQRSTYLRAEAAEREIPRLCGECGYTHREYESHGRRRDVD